MKKENILLLCVFLLTTGMLCAQLPQPPQAAASDTAQQTQTAQPQAEEAAAQPEEAAQAASAEAVVSPAQAAGVSAENVSVHFPEPASLAAQAQAEAAAALTELEEANRPLPSLDEKLTVNDCVRIALANSPRVVSARLAVESAAVTLSSAKAEFLPTVSASAQQEYVNQKIPPLPAPTMDRGPLLLTPLSLFPALPIWCATLKPSGWSWSAPKWICAIRKMQSSLM